MSHPSLDRIGEWSSLPPLDQLVNFLQLPNKPQSKSLPYSWSMSVISFDGIMGFMEAGTRGGGEIALKHLGLIGSQIDWYLLNVGWMMADAVLGSGEIIRKEQGIKWIPFSEEMIEYRQKCLQKRSKYPINVVLTGSGVLDIRSAPLFQDQAIQKVILTTRNGANRLLKTYYQLNPVTTSSDPSWRTRMANSSSFSIPELNTTIEVIENTPKSSSGQSEPEQELKFSFPQKGDHAVEVRVNVEESKENESNLRGAIQVIIESNDEAAGRVVKVGVETSVSPQDNVVNLRKGFKLLRKKYGIDWLDITAGGKVIHQCLVNRLIDETRLTLVAQLVGRLNSTQLLRPTLLDSSFYLASPTLSRNNSSRSLSDSNWLTSGSLSEGQNPSSPSVAITSLSSESLRPPDQDSGKVFTHEDNPLLSLFGVRLCGEHHLFTRSRVTYRHNPKKEKKTETA